MINPTRSHTCELHNSNYIDAFMQLCNWLNTSKGANWIQWLMATKQVHTSRGRIIRLDPTHNLKLIKTFSDRGALSGPLYEQVWCIFRGDLANKLITCRDKMESAGLFAGEREALLWHSLRVAQCVGQFSYSLYLTEDVSQAHKCVCVCVRVSSSSRAVFAAAHQRTAWHAPFTHCMEEDCKCRPQ